jgi:nitroreductase
VSADQSRGGSVPIGADAPILEVMSSMRAMRRLRPDPVADELLQKLIEAATWSPTASDLERQSFVVVTDREQMAKLAKIWQSVVSFYLDTFAQKPARASEDEYARALASVRYQAEHFAETPALIVACYDFGSYANEVRGRMLRRPRAFTKFGARRTGASLRNQRVFTSRSEAGSIYPAVQNMLLAARALGLGANMTTWHLMAEGDVKRVLGIPRHVHTYALIPVGWPMGNFGHVRRDDPSRMIHRDRW